MAEVFNQHEEAKHEPKSTGYQRENTEPVSPEECKRNGEWTKWVIERCTDEQKEMYYELRERLYNEGINYLSENHLLRYIRSFNWKV